MYGAILGDMIGAPYEFDRGNKSKDFQMFNRRVHFTDDSVMTIAVAEALMDVDDTQDEQKVKETLIRSMQKWGRRYPHAGYGGKFNEWLRKRNPKPYGSWGNGSAMRVSSVGWFYDTMEQTRRMARLTAEVTHNHPEGIKGAEATAAAVFLARSGHPREEIRNYITDEFGYDLSRTCDEIRPGYHFDVSCQGSVPEAITAFLEGTDFEDVIRTAVSLGGDCDTIACIAGGIAEAFYGVPEEMKQACRERLPEDMLEVLDRFESRIYKNDFLEGNEIIEEAISRYGKDSSKENLTAVLEAIRERMHADGHFLFPVIIDENDELKFAFRTVQTRDGRIWQAAFTSHAEYAKGAQSTFISCFIDATLRGFLEEGAEGVIINPWGESFLLTKELIQKIFEADAGVEYAVPDDPITKELLEDGSFLKRATDICARNRTMLNVIKLMKILRDSYVVIPCNAILSEGDYDIVHKMVTEAQDGEGLDSLIGKQFTNNDEVRLVPDILQNGDKYFFPVFSTMEEMGEYGEHFSTIEKPFLEAIALARHNEKDVSGIVINAFTEPFVIDKELFDVIEAMDSAIE